MAVEEQYLSDVEAILSHRYDNGADFWATPDKRLLKGSPFSTFGICFRHQAAKEFPALSGYPVFRRRLAL